MPGGSISGDNMHVSASDDGGGGGGGSGGVILSNSASTSLFGDHEDKGDRSSAGNRWPRQETLALLKIRSDMDVVFRDSNLKGPLWDDVSRKMADLGFHRSAKKCKEKFENVYKYHKRTKDGRTTKQDGKSYRFFDQLEALDQHSPSLLSSPPQLPPPTVVVPPVPLATQPSPVIISSMTTVSSLPNPTFLNTNNTIIKPLPPITSAPIVSFPQIMKNQNTVESSLANMHANLMSNYTSSSSTSSDERFQERNKKKRKWKEFFEKLMNDVIEKQEKLQKRFLEAIEKREHDRLLREESWKMQEIARMNREHEMLAHDRSMAAAKDAAVIAFLQKMSSEQQILTIKTQQTPIVETKKSSLTNENLSFNFNQRLPQQPPAPPLLLPPPPSTQQKAASTKEVMKLDNGRNISVPASPSRWPKEEIQALINLRTSLDTKYQENVPKGPLWEDISLGMAKLGYNRNAKRCKEKWENINKYFKKVKESNKRRPEDSKTCPYFDILEALYKEKNKFEPLSIASSIAPPPLMVQPEQQWPLQQNVQQQQNGGERETISRNRLEEDEDIDDEDDEDEDGDDEGGGGNYEIVSNKSANYNTVNNVQ